MKASMAIALALGGALVARAELASACGDGGSGDSDGGSGDSGGHGSSDSGSVFVGGDSSTSEPACVDASSVTGYRTCTRFGAGWSTGARLPALSLEVDSWAAEVPLSDIDVSGSASHTWGDDYNYRVVSQDLDAGHAPAAGAKLRLLGHGRMFYGGIEGGAAAVALSATDKPMPTTDGMTTLTADVAALTTLGAVIGVKQTLGWATVSAEAMAGGQGLVVTTTSTRAACVTEDQHWVGRGVVEARLRAAAWVTPWLTAGAYAGRDLVSGTIGGGLSLGVHLRAFDGGR